MTRQRFARADQGESDCVPSINANHPLLSTQTGGGETVTVSLAAQVMDAEVFSFTMAVGDPGGGEDLGVGSLFTVRLDVSVADAPISYKLHFDSLDAACARQGGGAAMAEGDFTGVGTKTGTATWDPPIADRYQVQVLATNSNGHNGAAGTLTIRTNNAITDLVIPDAPPGGGFIPYPNPRYALTGGMQPMSGGN